MSRITPQTFYEFVGCIPEHDDLDRCNCDKAGLPGHWLCGWCDAHKRPYFMCSGCYAPRRKVLFVIYTNRPNGERLYWSNDTGWVGDYDSAVIFSERPHTVPVQGVVCEFEEGVS